MTNVYITIDTEYSSGLFKRGDAQSQQENFDRSIRCKTPKGEVGIEYQMEMFDRHDLKAVFFVDPMPALVWGVDSIRDIVSPIVQRGHDVQLHLHTEWLQLAGDANPLGNRTGLNIKDFTRAEQLILLDYASGVLVEAGAPSPVAFRAGNYGANDDTLSALAELGMMYDTSHCPGISGSHCDISLGSDRRNPVQHCDLTEVPIGCIAAAGGQYRHAQITALSSQEILAAIKHAQSTRSNSFTLVSHSFELMSRDRKQINQVVKRRFESLCAGLERMSGIQTATYADAPPMIAETRSALPVLAHSWLRTGPRLAEQAVSNLLYGDR